MIIANPVAQWSDNAVFILDFMNGTLPAPVTFTRASNAWYFNSSGNLAQASTNVARFDYGTPGSATLQGLYIEESRTNKALQCRDLTQTAWVKTSATAALTQTGLDATANSASLITSTAANATALQTLTQTATSSVFSVYLKRVTGTGTIQLTQDNGTTWTTVTLTASWQRFALAAQSTTNPVFGIKIATSGDAVAWDCAQFEAGPFATSPILTTTASVTRALDVATVSSIPWFNATTGSLAVESMIEGNAASGLSSSTFDLNDGTVNNRIGGLILAAGAIECGIVISGATSVSGAATGSPAIRAIFKQGLKYKAASNVAAYAGAIDTAGTLGAASLPAGISQLRLGDRFDGARTLNGWVRRFRYWNLGLTNTQLQRVTT